MVEQIPKLPRALKPLVSRNVLGSRRVLLHGRDSSGGLKAIIVDDEGNLVSLIKGDYLGALKTLAVDDKGRMLSVLTDPEDVFGNAHHLGVAELCARLGCISTFERNGNVFFMESFEEGTLNKWENYAVHQDSEVSISSDRARTGYNSCKLTAGGVPAAWAGLYHYHSVPVINRIGYEVSFTMSADISNILFGIIIFDGTLIHFGMIRYYRPSDKLQYYDPLKNWQDIATIDLKNYDYLFHTLKFVIDTSTKKILRVVLNNIKYTLNADYRTEASTDAAYTKYIIQLWSDGEHTQSVYIDDVILTYNEGDNEE